MTEQKAPKHLSRTAKAWFKKIQNEYEIRDEAGRLLLQTAFEAYDRMKQAQETISTDGPVILDRFEQKKAHPLLSVERDARAQMLASLKALCLDLEPLQDRPGRPPGR